MITHLIEIDVATGAIVNEWQGDTDFNPAPIAIEGRAFIDVTEEGRSLGAMSEARYRWTENQEFVAPEAARPVISQVQFALLLPKATRNKIRAYRRDHPEDDDLEDFYDLLDRAGDQIDLNDPGVQALLAAGLAVLVSRTIDVEGVPQPLLPPEEIARIVAGLPPEA